jgi:hypothetical protein
MRITRRRRAITATVAGLAGLVMMASQATALAAPTGGGGFFGQVVCGAGPILPGTYISVIVTGVCYLSDEGTVVINGDLRVAHDAVLNTLGGGTLIVDGNFFSGTNSVTDMGGPGDLVAGDVYSDNPYEMLWDGVTVGGWYYIVGENGYSDNTSCAAPGYSGYPATISFSHGTIGGYLTYTGNRSCSMAVFDSHIGGSASFYGNRTSPAKAGSFMVGGNTIGAKLNCGKNSQKPVLGKGNKKNVVKFGARGQCKGM